MSDTTINTLPHISQLHSSGDLEQTAVLDLLFEPSPAIHTTLLPVIRTADYASYPELIDACQIQLLSLAASRSASEGPGSGPPVAGSAGSGPDPLLLSALGSHPRLGEKKIESAQSAAEQAKLQSGADPAEEEELARLNQLYEETFPGLRYVVFVNGRGRKEIFEDMKERIARNDYTKEVDAALQAMCDIAKDRASKRRMRAASASRHDTSPDINTTYASFRS